MPDYQNGKIYKLWSPQNDLIYIGSTTQPLSKRLYDHKVSYNRGQLYKASSKLLFETGHEVKIELIEKYECNDKSELEKQEGTHIRANDCVNKCVPGRTRKEWREENKETIKEANKDYYEKNAEQIKEYRKEYREKNAEQIKEYKKKYYENKAEHIKERNKEYHENNKEAIQKYRDERKVAKKEYNKQYWQKNKAKRVQNCLEDI